jgi:ferredoxin
MAFQSLDILRLSATTVPPTSVRAPVTGTVAKLIDVSKCIGCKACQTACMEWNDLRDEIGYNTGVYDNPHDLSAHSWTVMRFAEYENPNGNLEWLIRKDGCMHCEDPGCLKACPSPGAIVQYTNGIVDFHEENWILHRRLSVQHSAPVADRSPRVQMHVMFGPRRGRPGTGLREDLSDRCDRVRHQRGHESARGRAHRRP